MQHDSFKKPLDKGSLDSIYKNPEFIENNSSCEDGIYALLDERGSFTSKETAQEIDQTITVAISNLEDSDKSRTANFFRNIGHLRDSCSDEVKSHLPKIK